MPWVYILECRDKSYYTGSTRDLIHRFGEHTRGEGPPHTRRRRPVKLAWAQEFERMDEAYVVEHQIKGWSRQKKAALIEGRVDWLRNLSGMGVTTAEAPLTEATRRRIEADTRSMLQGCATEPPNHRLEVSPLDAVTKRSAKEWVPRSQRFNRLGKSADGG